MERYIYCGDGSIRILFIWVNCYQLHVQDSSQKNLPRIFPLKCGLWKQIAAIICLFISLEHLLHCNCREKKLAIHVAPSTSLWRVYFFPGNKSVCFFFFFSSPQEKLTVRWAITPNRYNTSSLKNLQKKSMVCFIPIVSPDSLIHLFRLAWVTQSNRTS